MKATLLSWTGQHHPDSFWAADLMIYTKNTRVKMSPDGLSAIHQWSEARKIEELEYMANTIPSSWEFVDYTFQLEGVTRALTHQLVRTRTASYAQQTMQILDVRGFEYETGPSIEKDPKLLAGYNECMEGINECYSWLIENGAKIEDARGVLPTNILTNIVMKANLRTYVDLFHSRLSPRNYGSIVKLCRMMREEIINVHPWAEVFLLKTLDSATSELDQLINRILDGDLSKEEIIHMHKLVDQCRRKG
jgi:flavin-dependent thymidylate synthase